MCRVPAWQSAASAARELVIQRLLLVGKACENEEQRLLERVHAEEERAHQSILTQQVHWTEALHKLGALRTYLVDVITNLDDQELLVSTMSQAAQSCTLVRHLNQCSAAAMLAVGRQRWTGHLQFWLREPL